MGARSRPIRCRGAPRHCCRPRTWHRRARALENQCYVVLAPTVGAVPDSLALDQNRGAAAIYGPVDRGFADDGVIARGAFDTPGWVMADLDFAALAKVRADGQVRNHRYR